MKYPIGTKIGELTIVSYDLAKCYYEFIDLITKIYNNVQRPEHMLVDPSGSKWKEPELEIEGYDMV